MPQTIPGSLRETLAYDALKNHAAVSYRQARDGAKVADRIGDDTVAHHFRLAMTVLDDAKDAIKRHAEDQGHRQPTLQEMETAGGNGGQPE